MHGADSGKSAISPAKCIRESVGWGSTAMHQLHGGWTQHTLTRVLALPELRDQKVRQILRAADQRRSRQSVTFLRQRCSHRISEDVTMSTRH